MRSEITLFINMNFNEEKVGLFQRAFSIFEEYHLENYDVEILELISMFDSLDTITVYSDFEMIVRNILVGIISEHGIVLNDDASLEIINEIAFCLNAIQSYEDVESLQRTIESEYEDVEKLGELFRFVSIVSVDNFMLAIDTIDNNIFKKLMELYANSSTEQYIEEDNVVVVKMITAINKFKDFVESDDLIGFKMLRKNFVVNRAFKLYAAYAEAKFNEPDPVAVAKELLLILMMSKESYSSPIMYYRSISNTLFDDINKITKVDLELNRLCNDFDLYKAKQLSLVTSTEGIKEDYADSLPPKIPNPIVKGIDEGKYSGYTTGYELTFLYDGEEKIVKLPYGVKGKNIPVTIVIDKDGECTIEDH